MLKHEQDDRVKALSQALATVAALGRYRGRPADLRHDGVMLLAGADEALAGAPGRLVAAAFESWLAGGQPLRDRRAPPAPAEPIGRGRPGLGLMERRVR